MNILKEIFGKFKIELHIDNLLEVLEYITISMIVYLILPNSIVNCLFSKLSTNKIINICVLVSIISITLFIFKKVIFNIYNIIIQKYNKHKKYKYMEKEILSLDANALDILKKFYCMRNNFFKERIIILPKTDGIKVLEVMHIIEFDGITDFDGGYNTYNKQFYKLSNDYFDFFNNRIIKRRKSEIMDLIKEL